MSVVIIGSRKVGKTSTIVALAKGTNNVQVIVNPQSKLSQLLKYPVDTLAPTFRKEEESFLLRINLPSGREREAWVKWIDTPGEAWSTPEWGHENPESYQDLIQALDQSQAVLLLLPPYLFERRFNKNEAYSHFLDSEAWRLELKERLTLLRTYCTRVQHILISIHKVDLYNSIHLDEYEKKWQYSFNKSFPWAEYDSYIRTTYFPLAKDIIRDHNSLSPHLTPKFFATTIHRPVLLELPWVYLGAYLANA